MWIVWPLGGASSAYSRKKVREKRPRMMMKTNNDARRRSRWKNTGNKNRCDRPMGTILKNVQVKRESLFKIRNNGFRNQAGIRSQVHYPRRNPKRSVPYSEKSRDTVFKPILCWIREHCYWKRRVLPELTTMKRLPILNSRSQNEVARNDSGDTYELNWRGWAAKSISKWAKVEWKKGMRRRCQCSWMMSKSGDTNNHDRRTTGIIHAWREKRM